MKMTISEYLLQQLKNYGIYDIFGVPGDYNLGFLDVLSKDNELNWVGNCNELNAAYAADGYARIKGMGALITTMGVGELSAINGIAGSYAEDVPVIQITGMASMSDIKNHAIIHHTLGDGNFQHFKNAYSEVTAYQTILDPTNAQNKINTALSHAYLYKKPVYIGLPEDIVNTEIDIQPIQSTMTVFTNKRNLTQFINDFSSLIHHSKEQLFVIGHFIQRYQLQEITKTLIEQSKIPFFTSTLGRNVIGDDHQYSKGIYNAELPLCKNADTIITLGNKPSEGFTIPSTHIVEINPTYSRIDNRIYENIYIKDVLTQLLTASIPFHNSDVCCPKNNDKTLTLSSPNTMNFCDYAHILEYYINGPFNLLVEQGTSFFTSAQMKLSDKVRFIGQAMWSSIGYTAAATLGTSIADQQNRSILMIGDGSLQMTAQCLSTMIKEKVHPIIIMNNNNGYTIERYVAGAHKSYNDIQNWNYQQFIHSFSYQTDENPKFISVKNAKELNHALEKAIKLEDQLVLIEIKTNKFDAPENLKVYAQFNAKEDRYKEGINQQDLPTGILPKNDE